MLALLDSDPDLEDLLVRRADDLPALKPLLADPWAAQRADHTVDVVLFTIRQAQLYVLLVERTGTFGGFWALPGGFVGLREHFAQAAFRELFEEVLGLPEDASVADLWRRATELGLHMEQLGTYDDPERDPRRRTITTAFAGLVPEDRISLVAGSDAVHSAWWPVRDLPQPPDAAPQAELYDRGRRRTLAFDHDLILADARARVASKADYTLLAFHMVGDLFTMKRLAQVYEVLWEEPIVAKPGGLANFRRLMEALNQRMKDTRGFAVFERTGAKVAMAATGRRAEQYRKLYAGSPGQVTKGKAVETRGRKAD